MAIIKNDSCFVCQLVDNISGSMDLMKRLSSPALPVAVWPPEQNYRSRGKGYNAYRMQWNNRGKYLVDVGTQKLLKFQELSRSQVENKIQIKIAAKEEKKGNIIRTFEMCKYFLEKF